MKKIKHIETYLEPVKIMDKNRLFETPIKDMNEIEYWEDRLIKDGRAYTLVQVENKTEVKGYLIYASPTLTKGVHNAFID